MKKSTKISLSLSSIIVFDLWEHACNPAKMVFASTSSGDTDDSLQSFFDFFSFNKGVDYEIILNGEKEHPKYKLDLVTKETFYYPIYDVQR